MHFIEEISERGIFHGIGTYTRKYSIESQGLFGLVYNRVGVTGIGRQYLALAGISGRKGVTGSQSACRDLSGTVLTNESAFE